MSEIHQNPTDIEAVALRAGLENMLISSFLKENSDSTYSLVVHWDYKTKQEFVEAVGEMDDKTLSQELDKIINSLGCPIDWFGV